MSKLPTETSAQGLRVRVSPWFKLKRHKERSFMAVDLKAGFGFIPETIIIERDTSRSNVIRVNAVLTSEEVAIDDKKIAERKVAIEQIQKQIEADRKASEKKGGKNDSTEQKPAPKSEEGQGFEIR